MITTMAPRTFDFEALEAFATSYGVSLWEHHEGPKGWWLPTHRVISLRRGLSMVEKRCTLAHELGHVVLRHLAPAPEWVRQRQEREADEWAAGALISKSAYRETELLVGSHMGAIARELGVTTHLVGVWRKLYERTHLR